MQNLIYCFRGHVLDVVMDLRKTSETYGLCSGIEQSDEKHYIMYIPVGFGHAFASLKEHSCLVYKTDAVHVLSADDGILWSSVDFNWPFKKPDLSIRDAGFEKFSNFESPF